MKTAFLIAAHNQPSHLAWMVERLKCDWAYIFIHIDKKSDISRFSRLIPETKRIRFLRNNERIKVNWCGFSLLKATLKLIDFALNHDEYFDRFCFLSGTCFPIKHNDQMREYFSTQKEFIRIDRKIELLGSKVHDRFVTRYWFNDCPHFIHKKFSKKLSRIKLYEKINLYHGCGWWCLTDKSIAFILDFLKKNDDYLKFFKYVNCPDEIFFQSLMKFSPFADNITHDFEQHHDIEKYFCTNDHGCHYIDWSAGGAHPKILDMHDLEYIKQSQALFARKFDEKKSANLLKIIEQDILAHDYN
ncbi:MAG TPA: beta-1,6-N-acetylglucosaminyltransferase [Cyclobacteriaceae bacterium]|nr:beta-1,6-N-acetylglucosaminyltransferase [Cyclobacteriaceae bacterium]